MEHKCPVCIVGTGDVSPKGASLMTLGICFELGELLVERMLCKSCKTDFHEAMRKRGRTFDVRTLDDLKTHQDSTVRKMKNSSLKRVK